MNPVLLFEKATFAGGWSNSRAPIASDEGQCKAYVAGGNTASGCLKNNEFIFNGVATSAGAGEQTTTEVAQNSNGQTTTQQTTANGVTGAATAAAGAIADTANTLVVKPIIMFIFTLAGWLLGIAGVFFNQVLIKTVFQFSTYFGSSEGLLTAWGVMRDVANIGLLFGFIFMGVMLILNVDGGGHGHGHGGGISAKKAIPRLIIFAVLLNFSLFASQAVIDVSNAFASTFTTLAGAACDESAAAVGASGDNACANVGVSGKVMQMAGISTIWNDGLIKGFETSTVTLLGLSIFVTITMVVLLAAGLMLVFRVVVLTMLMVTSPIGFAGMVIPGLQGLASKWWHMLISQSFFAPVMLLLVFISLKMAESLNPNGAPLVDALAGANSTMAGNLEVLVVFAVVIGLMISSLIVAAKMGAMGASFATNTASAVTYGSIARITNAGIGGGARGLRAAQQSQWASRVGTRVLGVRGAAVAGKVGEVAVNRALRPLEKSNLDMRRVPGMGNLLGAAGITAGAKAAEHATYGDMAHQVTDIRTSATSKKLGKEYQSEMALKSLESNAHDDMLTENDNMTPAQKAQAEKDRRKLNSLSVKELEVLHGIQDGVAQMAQNLTPEQFEGLMKSDKLDDGQKGKLRDARLSLIASQVSKGDKDAVRKWSTKDLEQLGSSASAGLLADASFASMLSDDQAEALGKSGKLSTAQKTQFDTARGDRFNASNARATVSSMSAEAIGKLRGGVVSQAHVLQHMTGRQIAAIDPSKLSPAELSNVVQQIRTLPSNNEFFTLLRANPKVQERWGGVV